MDNDIIQYFLTLLVFTGTFSKDPAAATTEDESPFPLGWGSTLCPVKKVTQAVKIVKTDLREKPGPNSCDQSCN